MAMSGSLGARAPARWQCAHVREPARAHRRCRAYFLVSCRLSVSAMSWRPSSSLSHCIPLSTVSSRVPVYWAIEVDVSSITCADAIRPRFLALWPRKKKVRLLSACFWPHVGQNILDHLLCCAVRTSVKRNANFAKLQAGYLFPEVSMCRLLHDTVLR